MKHQTEVKTWPNHRLRQACKDIVELRNVGVLPDGPVKEFMDIIKEDLPNEEYSRLSLAQSMIEREAMERYISLTESLKINA